MDFHTFSFGMMNGAPTWMPFGAFGLTLLLLWSFFWKGLALWHSAQRRQPWWFVILLIVNTVGILEIIYLFGVAKLKFDQLFTNGKGK